jgi:hypothetical protein
MPVKMRKTFEAQAAMERSDLESQLSDAKEQTRASMAVVSLRIAAKAADRPPLLLSVCSVSEQDEETWSALLRSNAFRSLCGCLETGNKGGACLAFLGPAGCFRCHGRS